MAFDVITIKEDFIRYDEISAGTLFSVVSDTHTFYLKLADYTIEDNCHTCEATNEFFDCDACVDIRTGEVDRFSPMTECIVYAQSELKLTRK